MTTLQTLLADELTVEIYPTAQAMGSAAAQAAAQIIRNAVAARGVANIILATGNSQLAFLEALRRIPEIPWQAVNAFHMDEYVHLPPGHPAGFPLTLRRNIIDHVQIGNFFPVPGLASDLDEACRGYEALLRAHPADLCCLGIGENGHLAFNEPYDARFDDPQWVKVITLTEASRRQQVGEGHFASLEETPSQAITLTIPALLAAKHVLTIAPEARKADAVYRTLHDEISPACPATILRQTAHARLFLDADSAAKIL
ncbi:MAG: glucosamine-6-phosphate deaminase [Anaerolineales bacterium]